MSEHSIRSSRVHLDVATALAKVDEVTGPLRSVPLFQHGSLLLKFYAPHGTDLQTLHTRDEVYVVAQGDGIFFDGTERRSFAAGDVLFVAAGTTHRFEEFSADFGTWVMFYGPEGGET
ncbi:MAG: cupin domain-containing protein [Burkholderiaceae bacterium]|nr:cupin domain-containing protein [Burkholderiaceae bacterium]